MAKKPSKTVSPKRKPTVQVLLEYNKQDQHRIVLIGADGVPDNSKWFEPHEVAHFKGYFAADRASPLKHGVFRQSMCEHKILSAIRYRGVELAAAPRPTEPNDE